MPQAPLAVPAAWFAYGSRPSTGRRRREGTPRAPWGDGALWTCGWAQDGRLGLSDAELAAAGGDLLYGKYLTVRKRVDWPKSPRSAAGRPTASPSKATAPCGRGATTLATS